VRNGLFGIASTTISGLSNVVVQLVVAALLVPVDYGRFALSAATLLLLLGLVRVVVGQTDLLRGDAGRDPGALAAAWVVAAPLAAAGCAGFAVAGAAGSAEAQAVCLAVAVSGIFVLQDTARFRCFRMRRAGLALASDLVVLAVALGGLTLVQASDAPATTALLVWTAGALAGFLLLAVPLGSAPRFRQGIRWLRARRDIAAPAGAEFALQSVVPYALYGVIALVGGLGALAGYRLIQLVFAPVANLAQGLDAVLMPRIVDSRDAALARRRWMAQWAVLIAASVLLAVVVAVAPREWGVAIFGATWPLALAFVLPAAIHGVANALAIPAYSALRLLGRARFSLGLRVASVVAIAVAAPTGALLGGAVGIAWALAAVAALALAIRTARALLDLAPLARTGRPLPPAPVAPGAEVAA
jgi:O-antigen/teichoic acid export membrane protein